MSVAPPRPKKRDSEGLKAPEGKSNARCGFQCVIPANAINATVPSATIAPSTHPNIAWGPLVLLRSNGIVMNGPTPIISSMLADVAPNRPMPRVSAQNVFCSLCAFDIKDEARHTLSYECFAGGLSL